MSAATLDDVERMLRALNSSVVGGSFVYATDAKGASAWLAKDAREDSPRVGEAAHASLPAGGTTHAERVAALGVVLRGRVERLVQGLNASIAAPTGSGHDGGMRSWDDQVVRAHIARFCARAGVEPADLILVRSPEGWRLVAERLRAVFRAAAYEMDEDAARAMRAADAADAMARGDVPAAVAALRLPGEAQP